MGTEQVPYIFLKKLFDLDNFLFIIEVVLTCQEKAYRRKQEEQRNSRVNSTPTGHGDYGSYRLNSLSSGMLLPPPPIPPNLFVTRKIFLTFC